MVVGRREESVSAQWFLMFSADPSTPGGERDGCGLLLFKPKRGKRVVRRVRRRAGKSEGFR